MSIIGAHALLYSREPEALRAMLRDVFGLEHVDAGGGWLIFRLPPAELGVHPVEGPSKKSGRHELSFMCDDIHASIRELRAKGVDVKGEPVEESYGVTVMLGLPGGVEALLYEPRHAMAIRQPGAPSRQPVLVTLLNEVLNGPSPGASYLLNRGDGGLLASLDTLSADAASARPGGRSSVAAHVDHLRYSLELFNRWARGDNPWADANWAPSWERQEVTNEQWRALRGALAAEAQAWLEAVKQPRAWDETAATDAFGCVAHLAYHLGAIRQIAMPAAGPKTAV